LLHRCRRIGSKYRQRNADPKRPVGLFGDHAFLHGAATGNAAAAPTSAMNSHRFKANPDGSYFHLIARWRLVGRYLGPKKPAHSLDHAMTPRMTRTGDIDGNFSDRAPLS
jgi:hypothetical protein